MKKAARQIVLLAAVLILACGICRLAMHNAYTAYFPVPDELRDVAQEEWSVSAQTEGILSPGMPVREGDYFRVTLHPQRQGDTWVSLDRAAGGASYGSAPFKVTHLGTIYDPGTGGFTGDSIALAAVTVFCLAVALIMFRAYRGMKGPAFYGYDTIHAVGFGIFALLTGLFMLVVTLEHLLDPQKYIMFSAYEAIFNSGFRFMMMTAPLLVAFAVAMAISNVALLRHERFSPKNVLGIGVALALLLGEVLAYWLYSRDFMGSEMQWRVRNTLQNVYATGFAYFECMLMGAIICGFKAARHVPAQDADYILILGCRFRKDGTLTPLLRGRVDRAIAFWKAQREANGREAVLMPSGGQGPDEVMPEAEAMRRYLIGQGIPEGAIRVEDRSRNTYQNMEYSKALIERENPDAKVVYATTNYHVFRSGVWASLAGLPAEGMGSRTKWWYWPNAFMRECAGLIMNRIPQELLLLVAMIVFFGALSMALG